MSGCDDGRLDDPDDVRLADYVNLRGPQWRRVLERQRGIFVAEGEKVVARLLATPRWRVRSLLVADDRWQRFDAIRAAAPPEVPVWRASQSVIDRVTGFNLHRGLLAAVDRPAPRPWAELLPTARGGRAIVGGRQRPGEPGVVVPFRGPLGADALLHSPGTRRSLVSADRAGVDGSNAAPPLRRDGAVAVGARRTGRPGWAVVALTPGAGAVDLDAGRAASLRRRRRRGGARRCRGAGPQRRRPRGRHASGPAAHGPGRRLPQRGGGCGRRPAHPPPTMTGTRLPMTSTRLRSAAGQSLAGASPWWGSASSPIVVASRREAPRDDHMGPEPGWAVQACHATVKPLGTASSATTPTSTATTGWASATCSRSPGPDTSSS